MLYQLHWQYKDGKTAMKAQREITSHDEMRKFVEETKEAHPLPEKAVWMACDETSKHFAKTKL